MKRNIAIIILSGLLLACLIFIFFIFFFQKKHETALTNKNDKIISELKIKLLEREKQIEKINNNPIIKTVTKTITKEVLKEMPVEKKDNMIFKFQDENKQLRLTIDELNAIIDSDTPFIESLKTNLDKTNEAYKKRFIPNWGINLSVMAGTDQTLSLDCYTILSIRKYFFDGRFYFGWGAGFKFYDKFGGSGFLEIGYNF